MVSSGSCGALPGPFFKAGRVFTFVNKKVAKKAQISLYNQFCQKATGSPGGNC